MAKLDFKRKRAPIGGKVGSEAAPAWWRAGQMKLRSVRTAVTRIAWLICPACTSSQRTSPGNTGRPAASAEVHPEGRKSLALRSKIAPEPAVGWPAFQFAA